MNTAIDVRPLLARVDPVAGESLMSLVARTAQANLFPSLADLLAHAGVRGHPAFTPFSAVGQVHALAKLLGVEPAQIDSRMHHPILTKQKGVVAWAGLRMERRWIEARARRVSPASLEAEPYHRLVWTHRAIAFCPESFEFLIERCPACGVGLGWGATWGFHRCSRCRASLMQAERTYVAPRLHVQLRAATDLVSPDPYLRQRTQRALPGVFATWDGGELFSALVELGMAFEHPDEERGSETGSMLSARRLGLVRPAEIARGYEVLQGWPESFYELVWRIRDHARRADPRTSAVLRELGLLGRLLDGRKNEGAFSHLLQAYIGEAAERAAMTVRSARPAPSSDRDVATMGLKQAVHLVQVGEPVLKRLIPDGECLVGGPLGLGGAARFHHDKLIASAGALRQVVAPGAASVRLGVPAYCLPAFVEAGLLRPIDDADALRMAALDIAYEAASLARLQQRFQGRALSLHPDAMTLSGRMAGRFAPGDWVAAFQACLNGQIAVDGLLAGKGSLTSRLILDRRSAVAFLQSAPQRSRPPDNTILSTSDAALLLGTRPGAIRELIGAGLLQARREGRSWRLRLGAVMAFHEGYLLSSDLLDHPAPRTRTRLSYSLFRPPDASTRHLRLWRRDEVPPPNLHESRSHPHQPVA